MATRIQDSGTDFKDYLQSQGNAAALDYLSELERSGHKIAVKGGGYIGYIVLDCVYGYDVFASDKNKRKYAGILQSSSGIGVAAVVMAYCIVPGSVHMLVKGDTEAAVKSYVKVVNDVFEREYDDGAHSVGYPFRTDMECKEIKGRNAIWKAMGEIYGLSEGGIDGYPYNSFNYVMSGNTSANVALSAELGITDIYSFVAELESETVYHSAQRNKGKERLNAVMEDLRRRYVYPYARVKEDTIALILGETCARTGTPYAKVAKKMHCYKNRHDLTVSTLCSFMIRRKASFDESTSILGMGSENPNNLVIETLAELNRLTGYSYDYIVGKMMRTDDSDYRLLITTMKHLHAAYKWSFPEMCEKFHIVRDIGYIRAQCNF